MTGSEKFWFSVFTLCLFQSFYWIFTLDFVGCKPYITLYCIEEYWVGYTWYQSTITFVTMVIWFIFILYDSSVEDDERPLRWFNPFYYINSLANKYLSE